jgi:hypothetical protein
VQKALFVIPANAGIQVLHGSLDPDLRRGDVSRGYFNSLLGLHIEEVGVRGAH